jgi:energy-coupling factor transporter ATP-binding protein EcfA2
MPQSKSDVERKKRLKKKHKKKTCSLERVSGCKSEHGIESSQKPRLARKDPAPSTNHTKKKKSKPSKKKEPSLSDVSGVSVEKFLIEHMVTKGKLFHCNGKAYARYCADKSHETLEVGSQRFSNLLKRLAYKRCNGNATLKNSQIEYITSMLTAKALYDCPSRKIEIRSCMRNGKVFIDMGDGIRQVKVSPDAWEIINTMPIIFITRPNAMRLPIPKGDEGDIGLFGKYLPKESSKLIITFIAHCLISKPPFAVLVIQGEQGSGKTTLSTMIRALIDPHKIPLTHITKEDDLQVNAISNQIICIDNASDLSDRMSDTFCRITTGTGFSRRKLYSDADEVANQIARPFLLNGISSVISMPDLGDRSIIVNTKKLKNRRTNDDVTSEFKSDMPMILGAILCGISGYLKHKDDIQIDSGHRLIEFLKVGIALERTYGWPDGSFMREFDAMKRNQVLQEYDCHSLVKGICKLLQGKGQKWRGSAEELMFSIDFSSAEEGYSKEPDFPKNVAQLGKDLSRLAPLLRDIGIKFTRSRSSTRREIALTKTELFDKMMKS